jgi:integrase
VYSLQEAEDIITALAAHVQCQLIFALAYFAGLRHGEIAGLQWGDFDGDFVHIRRAVSRGVVDIPKTEDSVRSVPLIAPVKIALDAWAQTRTPCDGWVFKGRGKKQADLRSLINNIIVPTLKPGQWKGLHAGRRGLGTVLKQLTGNSMAGQGALGHKNERTTKEHYEGETPEETLKGMKLLEAKSSLKQ